MNRRELLAVLTSLTIGSDPLQLYEDSPQTSEPPLELGPCNCLELAREFQSVLINKRMNWAYTCRICGATYSYTKSENLVRENLVLKEKD